MIKILMTYSSKDGMDKLLNHPEFKVEVNAKPSPEKFAEIIKDYDGLIIRSEVKVTKEIFDAAKNLKLVVRAGTGVDNIDKAYATQKGVVVMNVPGGNTISACEQTMALLMATARNTPQAHASVKAGKWEKEKFIGTELQGKVLGLIGLGRIGKEVATRAKSFEMTILAFDPFLTEDYAKSIGVSKATLDDIFTKADFISLHAPLNDQTRNLINKDTIAKMKPGMRIINCARGGIINEKDLYEALKSGKIKSAAIDVFEKEPTPADNPLLTLDNIIVTPHLGASTEEAQIKIAVESSDMIIDFFTKGIIRNAVNMPSVDMETYKKMKPYVELAEKIGLLQGQLAQGAVKEVEITYSGEVSCFNTATLTPAYLKGLLTPALDLKVNYVNSALIAKDRGIKVKDIKTSETEDYSSVIKAKIITEKEELVIAGTVFSHQFPRIVSIKNLDVDVVPQGCMLVYDNIDKPGIIGKMGTLLGSNNVNIASMQVGRDKVGGKAITIINIDGCPTEKVMKEIALIDGITNVSLVQL
ncbi:MAG: phosphoglycerate dehydrogenase [Elusimicrobia bacterium RIFOXYA2_FULL_39_19]|nr:MAG: phosphoglycerate dehydrogenase [Elusimicrobia bacterium RIFOXYA2_FULL_39_19]